MIIGLWIALLYEVIFVFINETLIEGIFMLFIAILLYICTSIVLYLMVISYKEKDFDYED